MRDELMNARVHGTTKNGGVNGDGVLDRNSKGIRMKTDELPRQLSNNNVCGGYQ